MKVGDVVLLREIQKNTEMGKKAIETLLPKISDSEFSNVLSRQELKYSAFHDRAAQELLKENAEDYRTNGISEMMLKGSIHANTFFDSSTSHIAGMMIQGSSRGVTELWKTLNRYENVGEVSRGLAQELLDFEQKSVRELRRYL